MVFLFGQGGWIWWQGALALSFVMLRRALRREFMDHGI